MLRLDRALQEGLPPSDQCLELVSSQQIYSMHRAAAKTRDLNDNVTPRVDDLPGLTTERESLPRKLDDVRQVDLVRLPRLQLHQCHDADLISVGPIHLGGHCHGPGRPEKLLRVGQPRGSEFVGMPFPTGATIQSCASSP